MVYSFRGLVVFFEHPRTQGSPSLCFHLLRIQDFIFIVLGLKKSGFLEAFLIREDSGPFRSVHWLGQASPCSIAPALGFGQRPRFLLRHPHRRSDCLQLLCWLYWSAMIHRKLHPTVQGCVVRTQGGHVFNGLRNFCDREGLQADCVGAFRS